MSILFLFTVPKIYLTLKGETAEKKNLRKNITARIDERKVVWPEIYASKTKFFSYFVTDNDDGGNDVALRC